MEMHVKAFFYISTLPDWYVDVFLESDKMNVSHCLTWEDKQAFVAPSGITKRVIEGFGGSLVQVCVPAGTTSEPHSHPHEQFVQVLAGTGRLITVQGERPFRTGSLFHFPANAWHSAFFESDTILIETNIANQGLAGIN